MPDFSAIDPKVLQAAAIVLGFLFAGVSGTMGFIVLFFRVKKLFTSNGHKEEFGRIERSQEQIGRQSDADHKTVMAGLGQVNLKVQGVQETVEKMEKAEEGILEELGRHNRAIGRLEGQERAREKQSA